MQGLNQNDVNELLSEGYSMAEINEALREVEQEELMQSYNTARGKIDPRVYAQNSAFTPANQDNLIKWQLELDNILERAEHILRGDKLVFDEGHLVWKPNPSPIDNILNEYGVQAVMRMLSMYLNRNTILGDYEPKEIMEKMLDFGREVNDLFFMKYEEMGLEVSFEDAFKLLYSTTDELVNSEHGIRIIIKNPDGTYNYQILLQQQIEEIELYKEKISLEKRKNYPMLIREIVDMVHSCYTRAKYGGERRSLREARSVTQTEPLNMYGQMGMGNMPPARPQRGILNPLRYFVGKVR